MAALVNLVELPRREVVAPIDLVEVDEVRMPELLIGAVRKAFRPFR